MELLWKGINYDSGTLGNNSIIIMDILCKSRESFAIVVDTFYLKNNLLKRLTKIKNFGPVILAQFFNYDNFLFFTLLKKIIIICRIIKTKNNIP